MVNIDNTTIAISIEDVNNGINLMIHNVIWLRQLLELNKDNLDTSKHSTQKQLICIQETENILKGFNIDIDNLYCNNIKILVQ